ncbi:MAG: hypothetical protein AB7P14_08270 [Blastocatellales bacterium]
MEGTETVLRNLADSCRWLAAENLNPYGKSGERTCAIIEGQGWNSPIRYILWDWVLHGEPDGLIQVDYSRLISDLIDRLKSGEKLDSIKADLHYGFEAEVDEFILKLTQLLALSLAKAEILSDNDYSTLFNNEEKTTMENNNERLCYNTQSPNFFGKRKDVNRLFKTMQSEAVVYGNLNS